MTRLLVAEDEPKLGLILEERLTAAQYTVDLARDGEEALAFASATKYDAMVLDVLLPKVDGRDVCRQLRASGSLTPILLLTALGAVSDRIAGLDSGADDYLAKPFAFGELLARLRALLRREAARKEPVLRFSELTLDPAAQIFRWAGERLALTAREHRILETLLRRPGAVVSRDAIVESAWGFEFSDTSNLVEVYIRRLRRKLAEIGAPPLIHTVRGIGYELREGAE